MQNKIFIIDAIVYSIFFICNNISMPETSTKIDILSGGMVGMISILIGHPFDTVRSDFKLMLCRRPCERMETNLSVQGTGGTILLVRWRERGYFLHLQSFTLSVSLKQTISSGRYAQGDGSAKHKNKSKGQVQVQGQFRLLEEFRVRLFFRFCTGERAKRARLD